MYELVNERETFFRLSMQRLSRALPARSSIAQTAIANSLLERSALSLVGAMHSRSVAADKLAGLPADLLQLLLDIICARQELDSSMLNLLAKAAPGQFYRLAIRPAEPDLTVSALICWRLDDAWLAPITKLGTSLEVLELGSCYAISDASLGQSIVFESEIEGKSII